MIIVNRCDWPFLFKPRWAMWIAREWPDGRAVLKGERSWRNARGVGINYAGRQVWIMLKPHVHNEPEGKK